MKRLVLLLFILPWWVYLAMAGGVFWLGENVIYPAISEQLLEFAPAEAAATSSADDTSITGYLNTAIATVEVTVRTWAADIEADTARFASWGLAAVFALFGVGKWLRARKRADRRMAHDPVQDNDTQAVEYQQADMVEDGDIDEDDDIGASLSAWRKGRRYMAGAAPATASAEPETKTSKPVVKENELDESLAQINQWLESEDSGAASDRQDEPVAPDGDEEPVGQDDADQEEEVRTQVTEQAAAAGFTSHVSVSEDVEAESDPEPEEVPDEADIADIAAMVSAQDEAEEEGAEPDTDLSDGDTAPDEAEEEEPDETEEDPETAAETSEEPDQADDPHSEEAQEDGDREEAAPTSAALDDADGEEGETEEEVSDGDEEVEEEPASSEPDIPEEEDKAEAESETEADEIDSQETEEEEPELAIAARESDEPAQEAGAEQPARRGWPFAGFSLLHKRGKPADADPAEQGSEPGPEIEVAVEPANEFEPAAVAVSVSSRAAIGTATVVAALVAGAARFMLWTAVQDTMIKAGAGHLTVQAVIAVVAIAWIATYLLVSGTIAAVKRRFMNGPDVRTSRKPVFAALALATLAGAAFYPGLVARILPNGDTPVVIADLGDGPGTGDTPILESAEVDEDSAADSRADGALADFPAAVPPWAVTGDGSGTDLIQTAAVAETLADFPAAIPPWPVVQVVAEVTPEADPVPVETPVEQVAEVVTHDLPAGPAAPVAPEPAAMRVAANAELRADALVGDLPDRPVVVRRTPAEPTFVADVTPQPVPETREPQAAVVAQLDIPPVADDTPLAGIGAPISIIRAPAFAVIAPVTAPSRPARIAAEPKGAVLADAAAFEPPEEVVEIVIRTVEPEVVAVAPTTPVVQTETRIAEARTEPEPMPQAQEPEAFAGPVSEPQDPPPVTVAEPDQSDPRDRFAEARTVIERSPPAVDALNPFESAGVTNAEPVTELDLADEPGQPEVAAVLAPEPQAPETTVTRTDTASAPVVSQEREPGDVIAQVDTEVMPPVEVPMLLPPGGSFIKLILLAGGASLLAVAALILAFRLWKAQKEDAPGIQIHAANSTQFSEVEEARWENLAREARA